MRKVVHFFDKLEDIVRIALSRKPILYAFIGAVGIVLIWKGVWETAELFPFLFGPMSVALGVLILLLSGLFVSQFIGDSIILSGFKREKKFVEKTEQEVKAEIADLQGIAKELRHIEEDLHRVTGDMHSEPREKEKTIQL